MGDVAERIDQLGLGQRTTGPVGEPAALVDLLLQHLAHQRLIGNLIAEAGGHGRHLGVEHRSGHGTELDEYFGVLTRGVEDLDDLRIAQQVEEGLQIQPLGHRVDDGGIRGRRGLYQAQPRPIGRLPHELGIDGDEGLVGQALTECAKRLGGGDRRHSDAIAPRDVVVARPAAQFRPLIQARDR